MPFSFSSLTKATDKLLSSVSKAEHKIADWVSRAHDNAAAAIARAPDHLPSKGIQVYTYISSPPSSTVEISLSVPGRAPVVRAAQRVFATDTFEIEAAAVRYPLHHTGRFEFVVTHDGREVARQFADIDPVTGLVAKSSSMDDLLDETRSQVGPDLVVCYGLYRAGAGCYGLPNHHQIYITVTPNRSAWQGLMAPRGSPQADRSLGHMVLPAPHDPGMNTMATVHAILNHAGAAGAQAVVDALPGFKAAEPVLRSLIDGASGLTAARIAPDIIASLAITQKDTIAQLCSIGARYFEFRPAHCHALIAPHLPFDNRLYFQHGPIPGMAYDAFLREIVDFLQAHADEIVVVHVRWDGVPAECRRPDDAELAVYLDEALRPTNGTLRAGTFDDLRGDATIAQLRDAGKRLVMVVNAPDVLSTYDDAANATLDGLSILAAFERVLRAPAEQDSHTITVAQCQATPTNMAEVLKYSIVTADASTMLLMATKARCGHLMLPWLRDNAAARCRRDRLLVVMDDFLDGSAVDVAVDLTRQRLG